MRGAAETTAGVLKEVHELLHIELSQFDKALVAALKKQKRYLSKNAMELYRRGKRFRPILLLLSARLNSKNTGGALPEKVISAAVSLEMLHVGSLIHDDIVDKAELRRGLPSINAENGHEMAMLIGDMQMIASMQNFIDAVVTRQDMRLVKHYLETAFNLCRGEIDELQKRPSWKTNFLRNRYLRTIDRKTGKLIALACEAGARLVNARTGLAIAMEKYGLYTGRAFQVMDDLKDILQPDGQSGKEQFIDLRNGRISLPYIYILETLPKNNVVKKILSVKPYSTQEFRLAKKLVMQSPGIDKAYSEARVYVIKAIEQLKPYGTNIYAQYLRRLGETIVNN